MLSHLVSGTIAIGFAMSTIDVQGCDLAAPMPSPAALVEMADIILRAEALSIERHGGTPDQALGEYGDVTFQVRDVLKGSFESSTITFVGYIENADDWNDRAVPYDFVRPGGRKGYCYALNYRLGEEYLLLLRAANYYVRPPTTEHSPYWSPTMPTNEQLSDGDDPWLEWVIFQLND